MAKISVMSMVFGNMLEEGALTDRSMLLSIEEAGFHGVELPLDRFVYKPKLRDFYLDYLSWSELEVTCIDAIGDLSATEPGAREEAVATLRAGIELAAALQCPLVLSAGSKAPRGGDPAEARRHVIEGLCACLPQAQDSGVTLAIENFGMEPRLICAAADCLGVLEAVPGLAFVFDTGNFYFAGEEPLANFDRLAPYTRHVHLKDWKKSDEPILADVACAPLDACLISNEKLVRKFVEAGMDSFCIEVGPQGELVNPMDAARRDLAILRRWLEA